MTSNRTIRWIENLADQEAGICRGERSFIDLCATKDDILQTETSAFVRDLKSNFEYLAELFNSRLADLTLQISVVRVEGRIPTFKLVRHGMLLSIWSPQPGSVQIRCDKVVSDETSAPKTSLMMTGAIEGDFGSFHDLEWRFLGSPVTAEQVARHYLTEFIQLSRQRDS